ncbi:hypothetical protein ACIF8T_28190 [Streptomyces sp. NPDC085946]|uniref:hypothetical protein n=1 Tax=Streptomyces sp. NPDC085946 TaxID=3365744 RepID=UPI0037D26007
MTASVPRGRAPAAPDASPVLPADLARQDPPVRKAPRLVAGHRRATAPTLPACLADGRAGVPVAGHPALPPEVATGLPAGDGPQVVEAAAADPSLPRAAPAAPLP